MAEPTSETPKKRRVRNPETFRERALKAADNPERPNRARRVGALGGRVTSPTGRFLNKVFNRQPFKFLAKILFLPYLRNSWRELRLVTWPSWRESRGLTFAVLAFAVVFGAVIAGVDWGLDKAFKAILIH